MTKKKKKPGSGTIRGEMTITTVIKLKTLQALYHLKKYRNCMQDTQA